MVTVLLLLYPTFCLCTAAATLLWCDYDRRVVLCLALAAWLPLIVATALFESARHLP